MKIGPKIALKLIATVFATAIGFCLGAWLGAAYCDRWVMPGWVRQYPHDGQLGLGMMMYAIYGGLIASLIVLVVGIVWTWKSTHAQIIRQRNNSLSS